MSQINYSRDPRLKPAPVVVLVDSDDEDKAPVPRKSVASNEVINIDSESDNDDDGAISTPGEVYRLKEEAEPGGDGNTDAHQENHENHEDQENMKMDESDNFDEIMMANKYEEGSEQGYEYEADYLLGGSMKISQVTTRVTPKSIDYTDLMNKSYHESKCRNLSYQYHLENRNTQDEFGPNARKRVRIEVPEDVTNVEMERIVSQVAIYTNRGDPVDWTAVARMHLAVSHDASASYSNMKLAIANVATQDSYNRKGNLFHCDLNNGISKKLEGHKRFDQRFNQEMVATVNDIKLSNSERFFISGSDDHKTMIWHAETGALMNTIGEHTSRVTRVAIQEYAKDNQDVFATGSADGTIKIYALDEEGLIKVGNGTLARSGGRRCISSICFGFDHFWDVVAVGFEGADGQKDGAGGKHGLISIYDANLMQKSLDGDLGYRRGAFCSTEKSVSCLSFSPSGAQLVCGTSGRASAEDDEKGDEIIRVLDVKTAKVVQSAISGHEDVNLVGFSPCQRYLISGCNTNETAVFDRRHMKRVLHRLKHSERSDDQGHAGVTSALWWQTSCGTSQSMLMTGGGDETVRLWDLRRASEDTEIWNLDTHIGPIAQMTTPPSMEHLIIGSDTGAVSIYSIDDGMVAKYKNKGMTLHNDDT
ncbi:hypothetical protein BGZ90_008851 [Linnemannia elongata]|nr:hypothetical protein BGZ90_008851 [Linnemannia elongata]